MVVDVLVIFGSYAILVHMVHMSLTYYKSIDNSTTPQHALNCLVITTKKVTPVEGKIRVTITLLATSH
jgi:hypothetical protein